MFKAASVGGVITNLPASYVKRFAPTNFIDALSSTFDLTHDPNIPAKELNLGFSQEGERWHEPISPKQSPLFRWDFRRDGTAIVTPFGSGQREEVSLTSRAEITKEDIDFIKNNPLVVDLVVAALAVYKNELVQDKLIPVDAFDFDANERIIRHLLSGGSECAENLDIQKIPELENFLAVAAAMDTACRTPERMTKELIKEVQSWYGTKFGDATMWIGCGTENIPCEVLPLFRPDNPTENLRLAALQKGLISREDYIRYRLEQIDHVLGLGKVPIMFPDQIQHQYGDQNNIDLITEMLDQDGYENEIVLHKLGSPFNDKTDYFTNDVLAAVAHLAYAVKTSDPRFPNQLADYRAIRAACDKHDIDILMFTGDDRGFPFVWEMGAREDLKEVGIKIGTRNSFNFIARKNISALLGYIGLNSRQTIKAVIELSKWYIEKRKGINCNEFRARGYLSNFWNLMSPAMALSTDCFFGPFDRTPAYTGRVESTNRFSGVLRSQDGSVLEHRGPFWTDKADRQIMDGRLLALLVNAGAITPEELPTVIGRNKNMLYLAQVNPSSS